jgi:hypothetical protein
MDARGSALARRRWAWLLLLAYAGCTPTKKTTTTTTGSAGSSSTTGANPQARPAPSEPPGAASPSAEPSASDAAAASERGDLKKLLDALMAIDSPDERNVGSVLSATFSLQQENPSWRFFGSDLSSGPFSEASLRLKKHDTGALLSLQPRGSITEEDLDLKQWGEPRLDINPRIPPSGVKTFSYTRSGVRISFQIRMRARTLRTIAIAWE